LLNALPIVLIVGFWFFMMRQMQSAATRRSRSARAARAC